jgi:hypothetical protein
VIHTLLLLLLLCNMAPLTGEIYRPGKPRQMSDKNKQREKIKLREVMTNMQFRRSGLGKLSSQELKNLEVWLSKWRIDELDAKKIETLVVESISSGGSHIKLSDGSSWKVDPFHIRIANKWSAEQKISIESTIRAFGPPSYHLKNKTRTETISAKLSKGPEWVKKTKTFPILEIGRSGGTVTLENGSVWKISLVEQSRVRRWKAGDEIKLLGHAKRGQQSKLYNTRTRDELLGRLLRAPVEQENETGEDTEPPAESDTNLEDEESKDEQEK